MMCDQVVAIECTVHSSTLDTHTDASYSDPLGELPERPKTAARQRQEEDDEFHDAELGDDLLPE